MAKKKEVQRSQAGKLIQRLDELAKENEAVALHSQMGLIYSWQTYRLENLELSIQRRGLPDGFIIVNDEDEPHITLIPLSPENEDLGLGEFIPPMFSSIEKVWWKLYCEEQNEEEEEINERWSKVHRVRKAA